MKRLVFILAMVMLLISGCTAVNDNNQTSVKPEFTTSQITTPTTGSVSPTTNPASDELPTDETTTENPGLKSDIKAIFDDLNIEYSGQISNYDEAKWEKHITNLNSKLDNMNNLDLYDDSYATVIDNIRKLTAEYSSVLKGEDGKPETYIESIDSFLK